MPATDGCLHIGSIIVELDCIKKTTRSFANAFHAGFEFSSHLQQQTRAISTL